MQESQLVVMDIGGGSTEIVGASGGTSLQIGAVRMTERFLKSNPVADDEFWACERAIDAELVKLLSWREQLAITKPEFVTVAGTAVTLAMIQEGMAKYDRARIDGSVITRGDAHRLVEDFKWRTVEERTAMVGMEPKRADVILAGALIYWRAMEVLDFAQSTVSTRGLRYGVLQLSR
jgi:exopolyphosphatase/guanosine-5'-triphosphate,3'-diphosphate pyrophosphatase